MTDEDFEVIIEDLEAKLSKTEGLLALVMAERDEAWRRAGNAEEQWGRCEAKLAKAVEALRGLMRHMPDYADTVWQDACETLAELEGKTPYGLEGEKA
jgi:hypothetical protein